MGNWSSYQPGAAKYINSSNETVNLLDRLSDAFVETTSNKRDMHDGKLFSIFNQVTLSSGSTYNMILTTPSSGYVQYTPASITCSKDKVGVSFYEDCGFHGGATGTAFNHNRNNTAASTLTVTTSATITANGTQINYVYIPGSESIGGARSGGEYSGTNDWVLKPSTNYSGIISNGSTGSNTLTFYLEWLEL